MKDIEGDSRQVGGRAEPGSVLEDRLARVFPGDLEGRHGKSRGADRDLALWDLELLWVVDHGPALRHRRQVDLGSLVVEGIEDVAGIALRMDPLGRCAGLEPDVATPDHRLVGVQAEDVEAHSREGAGDRFPHRGDPVTGLAPGADRDFLH